jgi:CheY-like chemotaxis protein
MAFPNRLTMPQAILIPDASRALRPAASPQRRALVVEDDPAIRSLVLAVLRREGFVVDAAVNGRESLALLAERSYALMVLDLTMPEMNGVELIAYLRQRDARILSNVLVITASVAGTRPDLPDEICHILTKPFELTAFQAAVASCAAEVAA